MTAGLREQATMILGGDESAYVELRAVHPTLTGKDKVKRRWFRLGELDRLERAAATLAESRNVYLGGAARREYGGGGADDVAFAANLWVDCDTPESVAALRQFRPTPTLVVRSSTIDGVHLQGWWSLTERLEPDDIKPALARLAAALGSDTQCVDVARVMRAVDTVNHKRAEPEPVVATYFTGEMFALNTVLASAPVVMAAVNGAGLGEQQARTERVPAGERHEYMKDTVKRLLRGGFTDPDCIECLLRAEFGRICEPDPDQSPTYFADWAKWAAKSRIAQRENAIAEFVARWKGAA
jgi:hypothetical protein